MQGLGIYRWPVVHADSEVQFKATARYEGHFLANKMHGQGCYTDEQGVKWEGKFHDGTLNYGQGRTIPPN